MTHSSIPDSTERPVLSVQGLHAGYQRSSDILRGCNLDVYPGELVGILGPNGAGKSTLVKAIFGLVPYISDGEICVDQSSIIGVPPHELVEIGLGYVPQVVNVFSTLTVEENLEIGCYRRPSHYQDRFEFVATLFPLLADRRKVRVGSLSGGQRQMVALGRALMMEPRVLLLDEPSAGLSPAVQSEVFSRIRQVCDAGVSIAMVEQNARQCLRIADRGYVLDQGTNAYTGTGAELLRDPKVVELYLGTMAGNT